jgi:tetratricopeptide (TPR) repeat protein
MSRNPDGIRARKSLELCPGAEMGANHDPTSGNRIFISCVSGEFENTDARFPGFRSSLRKYLTAADCEVKVQEDFRQDGQLLTVAKLDDYIRNCAAVIHLVGANPGATAGARSVAEYLQAEPNFLEKYPELRTQLGDFSDLTYTQWEAFLALHHGVKLFIYDTADGATGQKDHLARLKTVSRYATRFADTSDLLGRLIGDLRRIIPALPAAVQKISPPRFLHHAAEFFLGREAELARLDAAWADGTHFLSLVAWGGVGKTALLSHWIQTRFIDKNWLDADSRPALLAYFDWSFYDQGTRALGEAGAVRTGSVGDFFEQALTFFGEQPEDLGKPGKGARLAQLVRQQKSLLILDGLEPLQHPIGGPLSGRLLDPDLRDLVLGLAQSHPGLCALSSRQAIADLDGLGGLAARKEDLDDLPKAVAVSLLRRLQITGSDKELEAACETFGCHALSLTLLGRFLFDAHHGDIRRIDRIRDLEEADELTREERHRTVWRVLETYEAWLSRARADGGPATLAVLRLTGLFDRVATADCLDALRADPVIPGLTEAVHAMKREAWNILLRRLERAHLIKLRVHADDPEALAIDAHPLVREYFARQLRERRTEAFRAAHSRLFDHLCATTPHQPDTLAGLQPLYQAVTHGCLAGRQQEARKEVYIDRILRGADSGGAYSTFQLGAIGANLGAVAAFFEEPWRRMSASLSAPHQAWLLNEAAFFLRALGRLTEAVGPMREGMERYIEAVNWKAAAISASNLSELVVTLGRLVEAVADGRRATDFADRSGNAYWKMASRTTAADALHQAGERTEAGALFAEAERMQAEWQPQFTRVYGLAGFRYTDWLLAPAERAAWGCLLAPSDGAGCSPLPPPPEAGSPHATALDACADAEERANLALPIAQRNNWLLDIALDYLTLARAALYRALVGSSADPAPAATPLGPRVATAVARLRQANQVDDLPKALLTAAEYHGTLGADPDEARRLLAEAQQIAERGPMPLYLDDVHLHRARLFRDRAALAEARALIDRHGYGRRRDELADAEAAATHW